MGLVKPSAEEIKIMNSPLPLREDLIKSMKTQELDVLIIGGGATGLGCAIDSVTRGNLLETMIFLCTQFFGVPK